MHDHTLMFLTFSAIWLFLSFVLYLVVSAYKSHRRPDRRRLPRGPRKPDYRVVPRIDHAPITYFKPQGFESVKDSDYAG